MFSSHPGHNYSFSQTPPGTLGRGMGRNVGVVIGSSLQPLGHSMVRHQDDQSTRVT